MCVVSIYLSSYLGRRCARCRESANRLTMFLKIEFSETEVDYASYQSITRFSKKGIYFSTL
jgi:hypothetical protein